MNPVMRRLMRESKEMTQKPVKEFRVLPLEENMFEWHFTVLGPEDSPYAEGLYHGRVLIPTNYPFAPPDVVLVTPNGRFELEKRICLSISSYHPENWQSTWGIATVLHALRQFMMTPGNSGIGAIEYPAETRLALARESRTFKCKCCGRNTAEDWEKMKTSPSATEADICGKIPATPQMTPQNSMGTPSNSFTSSTSNAPSPTKTATTTTTTTNVSLNTAAASATASSSSPQTTQQQKGTTSPCALPSPLVNATDKKDDVVDSSTTPPNKPGTGTLPPNISPLSLKPSPPATAAITTSSSSSSTNIKQEETKPKEQSPTRLSVVDVALNAPASSTTATTSNETEKTNIKIDDKKEENNKNSPTVTVAPEQQQAAAAAAAVVAQQPQLPPPIDRAAERRQARRHRNAGAGGLAARLGENNRVEIQLSLEFLDKLVAITALLLGMFITFRLAASLADPETVAGRVFDQVMTASLELLE